MSFANPWALLLFIPILTIITNTLRKSTHTAIRFPTLTAFKKIAPTARQRVLPLLPWLHIIALCLLTLAAARPQLQKLSTGIPKQGIAIELVVDISSSMDMSMPYKQTTLSRMEVTKQVVENFAKERPDDLIGLITFARFADTICPLTLSHDSLDYYIKELEIEERANEDGTAFGDAVTLAAARLKKAEERYSENEARTSSYKIKSKAIILLTDGNNNCGRHQPLEGAALAKAWNIRMHTIAITDPPEMKTIQTPDGPIEVEEAPLAQERILRKMAETTGGIYRRAIDEASLSDIYQEINAMETSEIQTQRYHTYKDCFQPFAIAGLIALLTHAVLSTTWLRIIP